MNMVSSIEEAPPPSAPETGSAIARFLGAQRAMKFVAALFVILFLAAAFVPVGGAVIGSGQLGAESRVKTIAHPTGGVISALLVRDGARVKAGDVLVRLDTTVAGSRADISGRSVSQLLAQRARLEAEREDRGAIRFPPRLLDAKNTDAAQAVAGETRLFALRRNERAMIRAQLNQRVTQLERQIGGFEGQIASLRRQQALIAPERAGVQELWDQGLVTISRRNQLERTAADLDGTIASLDASIAQAASRITETRQQIVQLDQSARTEAAAELAQVNSALNQQSFEQISASDAFDRAEIRAPYDGIVDKLAFASVGEVIQPAQTIMEIVPASDRLVVESKISPADIDQVRAGQSARVRLSTVGGPSTPDLPGKVIFVSAERTTEKETGASYYRVNVQLDRAALRKERLNLVPGMPAEIFISTGSRSMLTYVTKPLADQFARAFRN